MRKIISIIRHNDVAEVQAKWREEDEDRVSNSDSDSDSDIMEMSTSEIAAYLKKFFNEDEEGAGEPPRKRRK